MFSFSLIERVILSAGAMLIFSVRVLVIEFEPRTLRSRNCGYRPVSFQINQMPEGEGRSSIWHYIVILLWAARLQPHVAQCMDDESAHKKRNVTRQVFRYFIMYSTAMRGQKARHTGQKARRRPGGSDREFGNHVPYEGGWAGKKKNFFHYMDFV